MVVWIHPLKHGFLYYPIPDIFCSMLLLFFIFWIRTQPCFICILLDPNPFSYPQVYYFFGSGSRYIFVRHYFSRSGPNPDSYSLFWIRIQIPGWYSIFWIRTNPNSYAIFRYGSKPDINFAGSKSLYRANNNLSGSRSITHVI